MTGKIIEKDIQEIYALLKQHTDRDTPKKFERLGGLTNHTYRVSFAAGKDLVVRLPGEGTEELINRADEKISTNLACQLNIDAQLLYFGTDGSKISIYIDNAQTMSPATLTETSNIKQVAKTLKTLHSSGVNTQVPFDVFDMASHYENIIRENQISLYPDYNDIKATVMAIKTDVDTSSPIDLVPCHNDPLCENWVMGSDGLKLIDWEYAGMNDGMWDLADVSIEADYTPEQDILLLTEYLGKPASHDDFKRFEANKIYLDYLWTLWGKTRVPFDGTPMEEYALERFLRLKKNINKYNDMEEQ